jgi:hypothetical protein
LRPGSAAYRVAAVGPIEKAVFVIEFEIDGSGNIE